MNVLKLLIALAAPCSCACRTLPAFGALGFGRRSHGAEGGVTARTIPPTDVAERMVFGEERECVEANAGRSCVCRMVDLLERVSEAADGRASAECPSYSVVPAAFVIDSPTVAVAGLAAPRKRVDAGTTEVDLDAVVAYQPPTRESMDDHYAIQYALVGSNVEVQCLLNAINKTYTAYTWQYQKEKHKTNTTVTGENKSKLMIFALEPAASKNYTCVPETGEIGLRTSDNFYTHHVIAVETPTYEIRGKMIYKTDGRCDPEIIKPVQDQLPSLMMVVMCPESSHGSPRYACDVYIETPKCFEKKRNLEMEYSVSLNYKSNYWSQLKAGKNALLYQKLLAGVSKVLADNLNKTFTVEIVSKLSLTDTRFEPVLDHGARTAGTGMTKFVSCGPGFGIQEVFCAACPPHHYSPDGSTECLKCGKGFHQPVAGSSKCVKSSGFLVTKDRVTKDFSQFILYVILFICIIVCLLLLFCMQYCRQDNNDKGIMNKPKNIIMNQFKRKKKYKKLKNDHKDTDDSTGTMWEKLGKKKKKLKFKRKSKINIVSLDEKFSIVHEKFGKKIKEDRESLYK